MLILGLETTCDETAASVVRDGREILSNVIASQIDLHREYGGVVPELACRRHIDLLIPVIDQAIQEAHVSLDEIDLIAVAQGPGLIGALLIGLNAAKSLAMALNKPFIGVNHIEAHLYAAMMTRWDKVQFPCLGVVISGGHTALVRILEIGSYQQMGTTIDDAIGEAFDKVAVLLGLPYPGGPNIEQLAKTGDPSRFALKPGVVKGRPLDFSFSGLKTSVLYAVKGQSADKKAPLIIAESDKKHVAAAFQKAALSDVVQKALAAAKQFPCKGIFFGGGVSNNQELRTLFNAANPTVPLFWPEPGLSLDNAVMIAGLAYHHYLRRNQQSDSFDIDAQTRIPF